METRLVLFSLLFGIQVLVGQDLPSIEVLENRLANGLAAAEVEQRESLQTLDKQFLRRLEELRAGFEKAGDKNGAVATMLVLKSIGADAPASTDEGWPKSVQRARQIYETTKAELLNTSKRDALILRRDLVKSLKIMEAELTFRGETDLAEKVEERIRVHALTDEEHNLAGIGKVQFFGAEVEVRRVVFVVDFSGSMAKDARLQTLQKELDVALLSLPRQVSYNVIYYSHRPWMAGENVASAPFRDPADPRDRIPWLQANAKNVAKSRIDVAQMRMGGATNWIPPVQLAMAMAPPPDAVFLMTDGEASDRKKMLKDMNRINPNKVPVHTIGLEIGGPTFGSLIEIAEMTGGNFSILLDGKLHSGAEARPFADRKYAPSE